MVETLAPSMLASTARTAWGFAAGDEIVPGRTVHALLGGGRRSEAYVVWNHRLMRRTVLKLLRPNLIGDQRARRSIDTEGNLLARLRHPGLTRLFDMDPAGERPFIEMEYVEGPRLSTLLRRHGPLDERQALPLGRQLAATLAFLHAEGILHLDVKPSNVIMGATSRLIDLSTARRTERAPRINGHVGTDAYMAPEQADPERWPAIGPGTDTWGLAATLYRAVAGRLPHVRGRHDAVGVERFPQLVESPAPLDPLRHPPWLVELIMDGLRRSPAERPAVAELVERLDQLATAGRAGKIRSR